LANAGGSGQTSIATHPTDANVVYLASANGGLFKTENAGDEWFSASSNLGAYRLGTVVLDPLDPEVVYVTASTAYGFATAGGTRGEIHRSMDGGGSWTLLTDRMGFQNTHQTSLLIPYDPSQPNRFDQPGRFDRDGDALSDTILVGAWAGRSDPPTGGVWWSQDEGQTFAPLGLQESNVSAIRAYPGDTELLVVTTYEGRIYRSPDLGQTWTDITSNLDVAHLADVAIHPTDPNTLYVACLSCQESQPPVWKTDTGGASWQPASQGLPRRQRTDGEAGITRILIDRLDPKKLYLTAMGYPDSIYLSTNDGQRWRPMPSTLILPDGRPFYWYRIPNSLTIEQAVDGRLYADGGGAWRYPDARYLEQASLLEQPKWEPATIGVGNVSVDALAIDPTDPDILYQGIADFGPYKSTDRGASFHRILGTGWPVTVRNYEWNGPYYHNYQYCQLDCSPDCHRSGAIATGGTTSFAISRQNPELVYSAFGSGDTKSRHGGINRSLDGGATWQAVGLQLEDGFALNPETCVPYGFRHLAIDPTDDQVLFAVMELPDPTGAAQSAIVYRTTDGGETWATVYAVDGRVTGITISPVDPQIVVLTTWAEVLRSETGGQLDSWQAIGPDGAQGISTVALSPHRAGVYVIGTSNQGIYYSDDAGTTWANNRLNGFFEQHISPTQRERLDPKIATVHAADANLRRDISAITFAPLSEDTFYVAGTQRPRAGLGVARITQAGTYWERLPLDGLSHRNVHVLAIDAQERYLYAGTHDGSFGLALK